MNSTAAEDLIRFPALFTDLYQLTMACGYWKSGTHEKEAVFHLFFRSAPFGSGFSVACGLHDAITYLENLRFRKSELAYLSTLSGSDGAPLFPPEFLAYLSSFEWRC